MGEAGPAAGGDRLDPGRANRVLLILSSMALLVTYVETMVVPAVQRFYIFFDQPPYSTIAWILSAYLVVGVAATPILGKMGDIYGKKRILVIVIAIYSVAVTLAGFTPDLSTALGISRANSIYLLIGVRGLQGIGMAMFPLAFAMIGEEFPPARVAGAQGIISAMFAGGAAIGLFGGAYLTDRFGWQFTYHTVVPFSFLILILTVAVLRESRHRLHVPLDLPGSALLGGALAVGLVAVSEGPVWGWGAWNGVTLGGVPFGVPELLVLALLLTVGFLLWEPRTSTPIVDFARLKQRNIWISNVIGLTAGMAMFLAFVTNAIFAQLKYVGLGQSVLQFGYLSLPTAVTMMIFGPIIGKGVGKLGPRPIMIVGSLVVGLGGLLLLEFHGTTIELALATIPVLVGVIALFIAMTNVVVLSSRREETGIQTGMNATFRTLGQSLGPVVATTIIASFSTLITAQVATTPTGAPVFATFPVPAAVGFDYVYVLVALLGFGSAVLSYFLINYRIGADGTRTDTPGRSGAGPEPGVAAPTAAP